MSEAKFTDGPWWVNDEKVVMCKTGRVAYAYSGHNIPYVQDIKSNANLIAAAPEMYALLTDLRHTISLAGIIGADNTAVLKSIDNLLAKARGEHDNN